MRTPRSKRVFDLALVLLAAPFWVPLLFALCAVLRLRDGGPVIFCATRAGQFGAPFTLFKLRTMHAIPGDAGVSGGDKTARITRFGQWLRRTRLDELPQLINVLRGDMSLVGPRPPDLRYVHLYPALYAQVLRARPGLTGLGTLVMHRFEDRVLGACTTARQTEHIYRRRCIARKARLDLIYADRISCCGTLAIDIRILWRTLKALS